MKDDVYRVKVCFGSDELICCSCTCKAGSCGNERFVCVHVPVIGVQLSHLLMDGLAEHVLIELSTIWGDTSPSINPSTYKQAHHDILNLISVSHASENTFLDNTQTIHELLKSMKVDTQKPKSTPRPPALDIGGRSGSRVQDD